MASYSSGGQGPKAWLFVSDGLNGFVCQISNRKPGKSVGVTRCHARRNRDMDVALESAGVASTDFFIWPKLWTIAANRCALGPWPPEL